MDPIEFQSLAPHDYAIAAAALEQADQLAADRQRARDDRLAGRTAGLTAQAITRWIARNFR